MNLGHCGRSFVGLSRLWVRMTSLLLRFLGTLSLPVGSLVGVIMIGLMGGRQAFASQNHSYFFANGNRILLSQDVEKDRYQIEWFAAGEAGEAGEGKVLLEGKGFQELKAKSWPTPYLQVRDGSRKWISQDGEVFQSCAQAKKLREVHQQWLVLSPLGEKSGEQWLVETVFFRGHYQTFLQEHSSGDCYRMSSHMMARENRKEQEKTAFQVTLLEQNGHVWVLQKGTQFAFDLTHQRPLRLIEHQGVLYSLDWSHQAELGGEVVVMRLADQQKVRLFYPVQENHSENPLELESESEEESPRPPLRKRKRGLIEQLLVGSEAEESDSEWSAQPAMEVESGLLTIRNSPRKIDLDRFDEEVRMGEQLSRNLRSLNNRGDSLDPMAYLRTHFQELVSAARQSPEHFPEDALETVILPMKRALRHRQSVILLGPAGSGKSSAIRALAREIARGAYKDLPRSLQIFELTAATLQEESKFVGTIEGRMNLILKAAQENGVIYFMDEFHNLAGAGTHSNRANDLTQDLKVALERKQIVLVGADTKEEFRAAYGWDGAFMQRFQEVKMVPLAGQPLLKLLAEKFQKDTSVTLSPAILEQAVRLSEQYDLETAQPRAAVNLLKEALRQVEERGGVLRLSSDELQRAALSRYSLDPHQFDLSFQKQRLKNLQEDLKKEVVGQEHAKKALLQLWGRQVSQAVDPAAIKTLLLVGPPGVGKSMLAEFSAKRMGYASTLIAMNALGSYSGVEQFKKEIVQALVKNRLQVFILDEIEKAPLSVQNVILQLLEKGTLTFEEQFSSRRSKIRTINCRNSFFIFTSNGAQGYLEERKDQRDFEKYPLDQFRLRRILREPDHHGRMISTELLARIQEILPVMRPSREEYKRAVEFYLTRLLTEASQRLRITVSLTNAPEFIEAAIAGDLSEMGYREAQQTTRLIENTLAQAYLEQLPEPGSHLAIRWNPQEADQFVKKVPEFLGMYQ